MKQSELRENNHSPGNNGGVFCGTVWRAQSPTWGPWNQRLVIKASPPAVVLKTPAVVWRALLKMLAFLHHCVFLWAMWTCSDTQTPEPATGESTSDNSITSQVTGGAKRFMPVNKMWLKIYRLQFGKILQMCFLFLLLTALTSIWIYFSECTCTLAISKNVSLESHGPYIKKNGQSFDHYRIWKAVELQDKSNEQVHLTWLDTPSIRSMGHYEGPGPHFEYHCHK